MVLLLLLLLLGFTSHTLGTIPKVMSTLSSWHVNGDVKKPKKKRRRKMKSGVNVFRKGANVKTTFDIAAGRHFGISAVWQFDNE